MSVEDQTNTSPLLKIDDFNERTLHNPCQFSTDVFRNREITRTLCLLSNTFNASYIFALVITNLVFFAAAMLAV